ncbi:hypothetical cytosolic protein [Syntrophus aciditrophicus SB]|uniref:Hypothetical cytosolic protein n=1 Tax=Syntrophus aciditrophicus (strain SB) TaxID=56780 RepID=Q2LXR9_SYNAS|nr:hypothetical cytosolic protein [Syntrophus aciditrophicus SB]
MKRIQLMKKIHIYITKRNFSTIIQIFIRAPTRRVNPISRNKIWHKSRVKKRINSLTGLFCS